MNVIKDIIGYIAIICIFSGAILSLLTRNDVYYYIFWIGMYSIIPWKLLDLIGRKRE